MYILKSYQRQKLHCQVTTMWLLLRPSSLDPAAGTKPELQDTGSCCKNSHYPHPRTQSLQTQF